MTDLPPGQEVSAASANSAAQAVISATRMIGPRQRRRNQRHTVQQSLWGQFSVSQFCRRVMAKEKKKRLVQGFFFLAVVTAALPVSVFRCFCI